MIMGKVSNLSYYLLVIVLMRLAPIGSYILMFVLTLVQSHIHFSFQSMKNQSLRTRKTINESNFMQIIFKEGTKFVCLQAEKISRFICFLLALSLMIQFSYTEVKESQYESLWHENACMEAQRDKTCIKRILVWRPEKVIELCHEVEAQMPWKPQDIRDSRQLEYLQKRAADSK